MTRGVCTTTLQVHVRDCGFVQLDHPAYSPDLAPNDYVLFLSLKSHLHGVHYPDDEAPKEAVKEWLEACGGTDSRILF